jgi:gluconokinase
LKKTPPSGTSAIILMGVSGCGKTTVGSLLAAQLGWDFIEGDDYHPAGNIEKMSRGIPLTDEDRLPWLNSLQRILLDRCAHREPLIMACSALKENYRSILLEGCPSAHFVYLKGDFDLIQERMRGRREHFMKTNLLRSQFETLEEPRDALTVDIRQSPESMCRIIRKEFSL